MSRIDASIEKDTAVPINCGHLFDIANVYCSDDSYVKSRKEKSGGEILWRNEPPSITYRRWVFDVPPCYYRGETAALAEEGYRPPWVTEEVWAANIAREKTM